MGRISLFKTFFNQKYSPLKLRLNVLVLFLSIIVLISSAHLNAASILVDDFNDGVDGGNTNAILKQCNPGSGTTFAYTNNPAFGNSGKCIKITYDASGSSWPSIVFKSPVNLSNYRALTFWVRGKTGGENFQMHLRTTNFHESGSRPFMPDFMTNSITTQWQKVIIPVDAMAMGIDQKHIDAIFFQFLTAYETAETFYIDDISFHDTLAPCMVDNFDEGPGTNNGWQKGNQWGYVNNPAVGSGFTFGYSTVNRIGSSGYGLQINWVNVTNKPQNDACMGMEMIQRVWSDFTNSGVNLTGCDRISMQVLAGANGNGRRIYPGIYADAGPQQEIVVPADQIVLSGAWQNISFNLSDFPLLYQQNICGVQLWVIKQQFCTNNADFSFYIDKVMFLDTLAPTSPSSLQVNGIGTGSGFNFDKTTNILHMTADSWAADKTLETIWWDISTNAGASWVRIKTDYDTSDTLYTNILDFSVAKPTGAFSLRVSAVDVAGNISQVVYNNLTAGSIGITKLADYSGTINSGFSNRSVMRIRLADHAGNITNIKLKNQGTASNGLQVTNIRLVYDVNNNGSLDASDVMIGSGVWRSAQKNWEFNTLSISSSTGTNLLFVVDFFTNIYTAHTFQAFLGTNAVLSSSGSAYPQTVLNTGSLTVQKIPPPLKPQSPVFKACLSIATNQLNLSWQNLTNETGFTLYMNTVRNSNTAITNWVTAADITNFPVVGLKTNTAYYFWLKAFNTTGSSPFSAVASNRTRSPAPQVPVIYTCVAVSTNRIDLTWKNVPNETGYTLFINTVNNSGSAQIATNLTVNNTNWSDKSLKTNTQYFFWVKSWNAGGSSAFSGPASNRTHPVAPQSPAIYSCLNGSPGQVTIIWKNIPNETGYTLYMNTANNTNTATGKGKTVANVTNFTVSGLTTDTKYYFWVKSFNITGYSRFSLVASNQSLPAVPPDTPALKIFNSVIDAGKGGNSFVIHFELKDEGKVRIALFDITGTRRLKIKDETFVPGIYEVTCDSSGLSPGVYIVQLNGPYNLVLRQKIVVIK
jgi:hypothetical protein